MGKLTNLNPHSSHAQTFTPSVRAVAISSGDNSQTNNCGLEVQAANSLSAAYISFHRPGIFAVHFGLDTNNLLSVGGWSLGHNSYRIFHEGVAPLFKAPLLTALVGQNSFSLGWNSVSPGQGIAELCNYCGTGGGDAFNFYRVFGNGNSVPTVSNRVSRIDSAGAYLQTSDRRVKSEFSPAPGLENLLALAPKKYKHWDCIGFSQGEHPTIKLGKNCCVKIGFVAQEVQAILPEAVPITNSEQELHSIDYSVIVACSVKSIQELHFQVQEMREQINGLKNQLRDL